MRGAGVHLAPFGSDAMLIGHLSCSGVNIEKAIHLPSGDHFAPRGVSVVRVICVAGPSTSTQRTRSCEPFGSPSAVYRRRLPSGDQRAADPFTRKRFCDPSALTVHSDDSHLSSILLTTWRV